MEDEQKIGAIAFIKKDAKFLFVRRSPDNKYESGKWGMTGGKIEFGESPTDALKREVKEEIGITVSEPRLFNVYHGTFISRDGKTRRHTILLTFVCDAEKGDVKLSSEHSEFVWLKLEDALKLDLVKGNDKMIIDVMKLFPTNGTF